MSSRIDRAYYRVEKAVVIAAMAAMALSVTLDVVYRRLSGEYGWGARLAVAAAAYGLLLFAARTVKARRAPLVALGVLAALFALTRLMLHAPSGWTYAALWLAGAGALARQRAGRARVALAAAAVPIAALLVKVTPEGYSWAKEVSLILLLWVGFLGASMCTYDRRHITIDFIRKLVPASARNPYECASHVVAAGFAAFLCFLSFRYVFGDGIGLYHLGGRFDHSGIPTWVGVAAVPLGFATMALRFLGHANAAARGRLKAAAASHG